MKKFVLTICLAVILTFGAVLAGCGTDEKVIKIGTAPYDYEVPVVEIATLIAEEQGYKVEVVKGDIAFQFLSLTKGDIDAWPGVWLPSIHATYQEKYGDQYELGGAIFEDAPLGWVVPTYVDIDSIADIKGNEDLFDHKFTGFEPGSGMMLVSKEVIEGYDLDLELLTGTMASMMAEVDYAVEHKKPIVFLGWHPHVMFRQYDLKVLEDPLGYWDKDDYLWGFAEGFKDKAPDMHRFMNHFKMSIEDEEAYLYSMNEEDKDPTELAKQWIADHRDQIDAWLGKQG